MKKTKIIIENVRGQWVVDKSTTGVFQKEGIGYGDSALIEMEVVNYKGLCCHPDNPAICSHNLIAVWPLIEE